MVLLPLRSWSCALIDHKAVQMGQRHDGHTGRLFKPALLCPCHRRVSVSFSFVEPLSSQYPSYRSGQLRFNHTTIIAPPSKAAWFFSPRYSGHITPFRTLPQHLQFEWYCLVSVLSERRHSRDMLALEHLALCMYLLPLTSPTTLAVSWRDLSSLLSMTPFSLIKRLMGLPFFLPLAQRLHRKSQRGRFMLQH